MMSLGCDKLKNYLLIFKSFSPFQCLSSLHSLPGEIMTFLAVNRAALAATSVAVLLSIFASAPLSAADLGDQVPIEVELTMEGGAECQRFVPESLQLEGGRLYKLRLINRAERSCYFVSNKLADAVYTRKVLVKDSAGNEAAELYGPLRRAEVKAGATVEWWLVPVRAGVFDDVASRRSETGMRAVITVK
jgi:uncharacterized cupredoxin-like copper-binding protein